MAKKRQQGGLLIMAGLLGLAMIAKPKAAGTDEPPGALDQGGGFGPFGGGTGAIGGRGAPSGQPPVIDPFPTSRSTFTMPGPGIRLGEGGPVPDAVVDYGPGDYFGRGAPSGQPPVIYPFSAPSTVPFVMPGRGIRPGEGEFRYGGDVSGDLTRAHYEAVLASGDLSPNIRSYEQFLLAYANSVALFFQEHPRIEVDTDSADPGEGAGTNGGTNGKADGVADVEADSEVTLTDTGFVFAGGGRQPAVQFAGIASDDDQPAFMAEDETFYGSGRGGPGRQPAVQFAGIASDDDQPAFMAEDETFYEDPPDVQAEEEDIGGFSGGAIDISVPQADVFAGAYSAPGEDVSGDPSWYEYEPEPVYDYAGIEGDE